MSRRPFDTGLRLRSAPTQDERVWDIRNRPFVAAGQTPRSCCKRWSVALDHWEAIMDWRRFLIIATGHLSTPTITKRGEFSSDGGEPRRTSWCSWTTYGRLGRDAGYWTAELPKTEELGETYTRDGGAWSQPFPYAELAHLLIPRRFEEEYSGKLIKGSPAGFWIWSHTQDIDGLSNKLLSEGITHEISEYALEIKLF